MRMHEQAIKAWENNRNSEGEQGTNLEGRPDPKEIEQKLEEINNREKGGEAMRHFDGKARTLALIASREGGRVRHLVLWTLLGLGVLGGVGYFLKEHEKPSKTQPNIEDLLREGERWEHERYMKLSPEERAREKEKREKEIRKQPDGITGVFAAPFMTIFGVTLELPGAMAKAVALEMERKRKGKGKATEEKQKAPASPDKEEEKNGEEKKSPSGPPPKDFRGRR